MNDNNTTTSFQDDLPSVTEDNNNSDNNDDKDKKATSSNTATQSSSFECNICFDEVSEPVVTQCGHLFCWSCIFQWLQHNPSQQCPVCKAPITEEKLIPIYGRGGSTSDPRKNRSIPQRPPGRPEQRSQSTQSTYNDFFFGNGVHGGAGGGTGFNTGINMQHNFFGGGGVSFGFGLFPGLFGLHFYGNQTPTGQNNNQNRMTTDLDSSIFLSRVVFGIGLLILFFVLFN
ncbi:hypothetical protein DLAC_11347 [Tieghemostelium lacteum]|uniref:RING-type E3 ubiquitin transferase n=1 Tax=Tieghemostelium lacteum TaxID=361077 RepID=A0A151Z3S0_TIELA|nr:hypothetical protein DLAC_11347 [Tieghemostelium lacteum]|eukprot:KYQ88606.1 hypothetical protein DLAC_11347 [Tieghemostelium lacteum]